ncbi:MAG: ATP-binding protein [Desulfobacterales bacterium]|nr:ATP-binding protein [Desulfobacterales bacterium]
MNPRSAIAIGMLPDLPLERYVPIGNSSAAGRGPGPDLRQRHRRDRPHPRPHHLPRAQRQPGLHEPLQRRQVPAAHGCRTVPIGEDPIKWRKHPYARHDRQAVRPARS